MSESAAKVDRVLDLAEALCSKNASESEFDELDSILLTDEAACSNYLSYCRMHVALRLELRAHRAGEKACHQIDIKPVVLAPSESDVVGSVTTTAVPFTFLSTAYHGTIGFFSQELPFSLLIAAVLTSFGLWVASMIYVSSPDKIARNSSLLPAKVTFDPTLDVVGKITGMVDCKWADPQTATIDHANVSLGRIYALASGLMEITYNTGAKVVLHGPVTYAVESRNGGFLSIGKLTGKVEVETAKGFTVRTPTATITDLGTEFGVEVTPDKATVVYVIRGAVETRRDERTGGEPICIRLAAGEAIRFGTTTQPPVRIDGRDVCEAFVVPDLQRMSRESGKSERSRWLLSPISLIASAYHREEAAGRENRVNDARREALQAIVEAGLSAKPRHATRHSCFDTRGKTSATDFVGLRYDQSVQFDRIEVSLGRQTREGGNWSAVPSIFILKNPVDTGNIPPESDPTNWREIPLQAVSNTAFTAKPAAGPGEVLGISLAGLSPEKRTGYGWAVGGVPGNGSLGYVSIVELRAYTDCDNGNLRVARNIAQTLQIPGVAYLGLDLQTSAEWRSRRVPKSGRFDPNGDSVFGSDGYVIACKPATTQPRYGDFATVVSSLPPYISSVAVMPGIRSCFSDSFAALDYPSLPILQEAPKMGITGLWLHDGAGNRKFFTITLARNTSFVLTTIVGTHNDNNSNAVQVGVTGPDKQTKWSDKLWAIGHAQHVFFRLSGNAGDSFTICLVGGEKAATISGLAFEAVPVIEPIAIRELVPRVVNSEKNK